jgi:hypothetical protein
MGHFRLVYQGYPLDLPAHEPSIALWAASGSFPGQTLGDFVGLDLKVTSPEFFFDPNNDPEDDISQWINAGLNTQWIKIPLKRFQNRDFRTLETINIDFRGEGTHNTLNNEEWWEAPGLITTYSDELFSRAEISLRHDGDDRFSARVSGETQFGTTFDLAFSAPLIIRLTAYRESATAEELLRWFDRFLRKDDFIFSQQKRGEDLYLNGVAK